MAKDKRINPVFDVSKPFQQMLLEHLPPIEESLFGYADMDDIYGIADSLYLEQYGGVSGEFHPDYPNVKMFDMESGEFTDDFREIQEELGGVAQYKIQEPSGERVPISPRDFYYMTLGDEMKQTIDMASPMSMDIGDDIKNPLYERVLKAYGDKPLEGKDGEFLGPNELYNSLTKLLLESSNPESINEDMSIEKLKKLLDTKTVPIEFQSGGKVPQANNLLTDLLLKAESNWGMDDTAIQDAMARMAFHESKYGTPGYQPVQSGGGPGMGMYQYEIDRQGGFLEGYKGIQGGAHTAINRLIEFNKASGNKYDISFLDAIISQDGPNPENLYDFSGLTPEQQNMLFLADKLGDPTANMGTYDLNKDGILSDRELAGFHTDEHWAGYEGAGTLTPTKEGEKQRKSFIDKLVLDYPYYNKP